MKAILDSLGLAAVNPGTWHGAESFTDDSANLIESINPATGEIIASVRSTTPDQYDALIQQAQESFRTWRMMPAPQRGEIVRTTVAVSDPGAKRLAKEALRLSKNDTTGA